MVDASSSSIQDPYAGLLVNSQNTKLAKIALVKSPHYFDQLT